MFEMCNRQGNPLWEGCGLDKHANIPAKVSEPGKMQLLLTCVFLGFFRVPTQTCAPTDKPTCVF